MLEKKFETKKKHSSKATRHVQLEWNESQESLSGFLCPIERVRTKKERKKKSLGLVLSYVVVVGRIYTPFFFCCFFQVMNVKSSTNIRSRRSKGKVRKREKGEGDVEQYKEPPNKPT